MAWRPGIYGYLTRGISVINGIVRYRMMNRVLEKNLCKATIDFCRRSLMNGIDRES
jgi:hypothetical protein